MNVFVSFDQRIQITVPKNAHNCILLGITSENATSSRQNTPRFHAISHVTKYSAIFGAFWRPWGFYDSPKCRSQRGKSTAGNEVGQSRYFESGEGLGNEVATTLPSSLSCNSFLCRCSFLLRSFASFPSLAEFLTCL